MADLDQILRDLVDERARIDNAIAQVSELVRVQTATLIKTPGKRGRKGMSAEQRQEVSNRMRNYWEQRRGARAMMSTAS